MTNPQPTILAVDDDHRLLGVFEAWLAEEYLVSRRPGMAKRH